MKVLFVGPYPPPHGGISVHVWSAHALMKRAGQQSNVLNVDPRAPESEAYIKVSGALDLARELIFHARNGWTFDVHTNGHNRKSWVIALACGLAGQLGPGATLTLHSGMSPTYIRSAPHWTRRMCRLACLLHRKVVCVNGDIANAVTELSIPPHKIEITPAFLQTGMQQVATTPEIENWFDQHWPIVTATLFFRPEYGFELLLDAVKRLRSRHPRIGCLVMGSGEDRERAAELVASRGLKDCMFLIGDVDHALCLSLMGRSTVFVRPTLRDGDSVSIREAVALGVPVVASNVGTRPDGVALFEPGDVEGLVERVEKVLEDALPFGPHSPNCRGGL